MRQCRAGLTTLASRRVWAHVFVPALATRTGDAQDAVEVVPRRQPEGEKIILPPGPIHPRAPISPLPLIPHARSQAFAREQVIKRQRNDGSNDGTTRLMGLSLTAGGRALRYQMVILGSPFDTATLHPRLPPIRIQVHYNNSRKPFGIAAARQQHLACCSSGCASLLASCSGDPPSSFSTYLPHPNLNPLRAAPPSKNMSMMCVRRRSINVTQLFLCLILALEIVSIEAKSEEYVVSPLRS